MTTQDPIPAITPPVGLETTITARRAELVALLIGLKRDTSAEAAATRIRLKKSLSQLGLLIKESVVDGWSSLSEAGTIKLDRWLAESRQS